MIILLNGSFGVGKSTVAVLLHKTLPTSAVYNPELVGSVLMRLPRWIPLDGSHTGDFQNIVLWRKSVVWGVRLLHSFVRGPIIVPMTFTHRPYFDEIVGGLRRFEPTVRIFCLTSSESTVWQRLAKRGSPTEGPEAEWIARRVPECIEAHRDPHFGERVDTEGRTAEEVVAEIVGRLQRRV